MDCPLIYRITLIPWLAWRSIREGKAWHMMLSAELVVISAIAFGWLVGLNHYGFAGRVFARMRQHNIPPSMWSIVAFVLVLWLMPAFITAVQRSRRFEKPADVEVECHCLALPIILLLPGSVIVKIVAPNPSSSTALIASNALLLIVYAYLAITIWLLLTERGVQGRRENNSARWVACWPCERLLQYKNTRAYTLAVPLALVLAGGAWFGYGNPMLWIKQLSPLMSGVLLPIELLIFWALMAWITGSHRARNVGDPHGFKVAALSIGWSLSWTILALIIVSYYRSLAMAQLRDFTTYRPDEIIAQGLIQVVLIFGAIDMFLILNGLLTLSARYHPLVANNEDTLGLLKQPAGERVEHADQMAAMLERLGQIQMPSWRATVRVLRQVFTLSAPKTGKELSTADSASSPAAQMQGFVFLILAVITYGFTSAKLSIFPIIQIAGLHRYDLDFISGVGSAIVCVSLLVIALRTALRLFGSKVGSIAILASIGYSLVPLTLLTAIMSFAPRFIPVHISVLLMQLSLLWGLGYVILDLGASLIPGRRLLIGLPLVILAALTAYIAAGRVVQGAHLCLLRASAIPVAQVRDTLTDDLSGVTRDDVQQAISRMGPADLVDVKAADLVEQVAYLRRLETRFYKDGGYPAELSPIRIRAEVTANTGWMRRLCPVMTQLTRSAKSPDEVVPIVLKWLKSTLVEITPLSYPFGDKFDQDPLTTLTCKRGSELDAAILMVASLRASGVAARTSTVYPDQFVSGNYSLAEYYDGFEWKACYPQLGGIAGPTVIASDAVRFQRWAEKIRRSSNNLVLYVLVNGMWCPYNTGSRDAEAGFSIDLAPGTYLAQYCVGTTYYMKQFILRPERAR